LKICNCRNLTLEEWEDDSFTPKMGTWESTEIPEISKFDCKGQNTSHGGVLYIIGSYWSVDVKNGLAWAILTSITQVMIKRKARSQTTSWLLTTKSRELTRARYVQVEYNTPLESSRRGLQLFFRPHYNRRSAQEVMCFQNCESPSCWNFETPSWESQDKKPFGCGPHGEL
jgi:hypothetical protein